MNIIEDIKSSFRQGSTLTRLIYLNLGLFVAVNLVKIILMLSSSADYFDSFLRFLALPSNLEILALRPWTLLSYMFLHVDFIHILMNLLWLWWFGRLFIEELGRKKLLSTYLVGGLSGGLLYILFYNAFPVFESVRSSSIAMGASASVMAVVIAAATYRPERRMNLIFIGPVKVIYIALAMFIATSLVDFTSNTGGKIAHIGGAIAGFLIAYNFRKGKDITRGFDRLMDRVAVLFSRRGNMRVSYRRSEGRRQSASAKPSRDDLEYRKEKGEEQKEIDSILDKISKSGYESLSAREKELLFKMSDKK